MSAASVPPDSGTSGLAVTRSSTQIGTLYLFIFKLASMQVYEMPAQRPSQLPPCPGPPPSRPLPPLPKSG
ncbi:hypothetical protein F4809DRAFT_639052 [Biscogniauxia mediterranea]|nr:hypothetical protein F4809DRAFT_639052 [Biscogniauxia mediterranea]